VLAFALVVLALLRSRGLYSLPIRLRILDDLGAVLIATTLSTMMIGSIRLALDDASYLAAESARLWAFATIYLGAGRIALYWMHQKARREGELTRPTLIVGAGKVGSLTARRLRERPELGLVPVAFLDKEPLLDEQTLGLPVVGASWDLDEIVARYDIEQVIVTFSTAPDNVLLELVRRCDELGVAVAVVPRMFESVTEQLSVEHLGAMPLVTARATDPRGWQFNVKYGLDRVLAVLLLFVMLPGLAATALLLLLSIGRPILFRQRRVGRDGREFQLIKFRTMRFPGAEVDSTAQVELTNGNGPGGVEGVDRRTPFGSFLRRSSIDELPQLLNVLKGEMSLVGPRPERPEFVRQFERRVHRYGERHRVKSGITGWAQVHGLRGKTSIADRAEWDNFYIENFSLWLDLKIMIMTVGAVISSFRKVE
jgi:exopolysaccharide biosynthesis polyprenyl glycosylphosphotransferase